MKPQTRPTWEEGVTLPAYAPMKQDITVDVAIAGGGITGILAAYVLAKAGKSVAVLEGNRFVSGATAYTTAFLTQLIDTRS